ncbi:hypothetical protein K505DRAFT_332413 [Melanomma pulvis-pyrius CBS 109.77]|uniref:Uncharacterized protein n=1 Tax=Melanomma pulvis-pyrius CBS 109.77 TaxID=1314802 RepID=A0A6A6XT74_9PLEO|nr:hypothetical protein K505DRAFT_332413 [Melanomma pulvis-pyrius CBS 109.77]
MRKSAFRTWWMQPSFLSLMHDAGVCCKKPYPTWPERPKRCTEAVLAELRGYGAAALLYLIYSATVHTACSFTSTSTLSLNPPDLVHYEASEKIVIQSDKRSVEHLDYAVHIMNETIATTLDKILPTFHLYNLSAWHWSRYEQSRETDDLDRAMKANTAAIETVPLDNDLRLTVLHNLMRLLSE